MNRLFVMLMLMSTLLWSAQPFREHRYIYSIDKHLDMNGTISFEDEKMEILYNKPQFRRIVYDGETMDTYDHEVLTQHIDLAAQPMMKLYMHFIFQLYQGNFKALEENFNIIYQGDLIRLTPIPPADKVITSVEVTRQGEVIRKIITKMGNGDEITLEMAP